ncbi:3-dehydroquinate synthase [Roseivirga sp. BDSF3-8]|uniref:3-dehydroquinate synthase n=1 Tax=Roseivirga sp. BDSF3-8 TaxID=3241598 RepID=UPI00353190DF
MTIQNVQIEKDLDSLSAHIATMDFTSLAVLVDENTEAHCYPWVKRYLPEHTLIRITSGEKNKTLDTCQKIWQAMTDAKMDRRGLMLNLGGGVIGDMGGFCAATYKRGINFINVPTTLLAQVDASVGGKLGIDFGALKNHIGIFRIPDRVLIYPVLLQTLPERELRSGFAEVLKHGLIADAAYWERSRNLSLASADWTEVVAASVKIKKEVVENDPTEKGLRKILNFGHTVGHAVESYFLDTENHLLHGEAIAIGMVAEAYLSASRCGLQPEECDMIRDTMLSVYGHAPIGTEHFDAITALTVQDKKNEGGNVLAALLNGIGKARYDVQISAEEVRKSLIYYNEGK